MRRLVALTCYALILFLAWRWSYSSSGFLLFALGPILLLDRYALRLLPWSRFNWRTELSVLAISFLVGALAFYFMRPGIVSLAEAASRGSMVCLVVFLSELLVSLAARSRNILILRGAVVALIVFLIPVIGALHPLHTIPKRTPAALGLKFEDVRFRTADGLELAAWFIPHPEPRGNLIFCHGHGRNRGHSAGLLQTCHDTGLNVLAFDFRGHGDSPGETSTFGHREVQDLLAAEAYLNARYTGKPVFLVGVSLGAAVSLQALPQMPCVRGVWSEGAFARFSHAADFMFTDLPTVLRRPLVNGYYLLGWLDCGLWGPAINPIDRLRGVNVPIAFCHATHDELIPFRDGQLLFDSYQGPKRCWWVEGASHYNIRQRHREEYLQRLRSFLEECLQE